SQQRITVNHANSKRSGPRESSRLLPILEPDERENFNKLLGDKVDAAFQSPISDSAYQPGTLTNTILQSSTTTPKKTPRQPATPSQTRRTISSSLSTRLKNLNAEEVTSTAAVIQEDQHRQFINMFLHDFWD
ncbi:hypothetical protein DSO57_1017526, partial [Entomophthora muscae]